jgi:hypothetical protein
MWIKLRMRETERPERLRPARRIVLMGAEPGAPRQSDGSGHVD